MKRSVRSMAVFLALILLLGSMFVGHAVSQVQVSIDGTVTTFNAEIINGTTYLPLRAFCQSMANCNIGWDGWLSQATVSAAGLDLTVSMRLPYIQANGRYLYAANGIRNIDGSLYVPIRLLAKCFNADVIWVNWNTPIQVIRKGGAIAPAGAYYNEADLYWLSHIIFAEAGNEPLTGKIAVGNVVMNRVKSNRFPNTVYDVIFQKNQFSPASNGRINRTPNADSVVAAKIALEGDSVAGNSYFFQNKALVKNSWMERSCRYVATIGNHTFYTLAS